MSCFVLLHHIFYIHGHGKPCVIIEYGFRSSYWPIVGKNALHLCVNFRSCKPEPVMTGSGLIWLDEMADLMMLNAPIEGVLINRRMPMTLLSEGWMTLHCGWTTARGTFGTIVCDPTGKKDLCYREGAISYMPQSMMCRQRKNALQPAC